MYNKILLASLSFSLSMLSSAQIFAAGSCEIESAPIPALAEYVRSVDARLAQVTMESQQLGVCGITQWWASSSVERTIDTIDRALLEIPLSTNMLLDFRYNIEVAANGETRAPVLRDGQIFARVGDRISSTIANIANRCTLDGSIRSSLSSLLSENQTLENIYKQAVLGVPTAQFSGLSQSGVLIATAINVSYIPPSTASCKDQNNVSESVAKMMKSLENLGTNNQNVWADWQKAILLFRWWDGSKKSLAEYSATQRQLLQWELARQGYSSRSATAMLGNFDCFKWNTQWDMTAESATLAERRCFANPILGVENILLPWRQLVDRAPTTDARSYAVNNLSREQRLKQSIVATANKLETYRTPSIDIKSAIMSNLIDIHIWLLSTSEQIEKRLPIMYNNCMKAQPSISCPRP